MRWGRFGGFLVIVLAILGLTAGTSMNLWKAIPLGLDLKGGFDLLYQVEPGTDGLAVTPDGVQAALQAVQLRVNSTGMASPTITLENGTRIRVDVAGAYDVQKAKQIIGETADLEIYGNVIVDPKTKSMKPDPTKLLVPGRDIESNAAWAQTDQGNVVNLTFKNAGKWQQITTQYLKKPIYTFLNGQLINEATVQSVISNGQTELTGLGSAAACQTLAKQLNAGALPYPLKLLSSTSVGPSLGKASLHATLYAGLVAVLLIFLFMLVVYRLAGLIADLALVAYAYLVLLTFSGLHVVLTLPGLAALVLGIGMAVDANIITYERIKDEVRNGRSLQSGVISGNKRALRTILDSNATTFIAGAVMYWFGQGDIRGFAVALMLSIVISLLTAVLLSRSMLVLFTKSNATRRPWLYGIGKGAVQR